MKKLLLKWLHKIIDARVNEILNNQNEVQFYETPFLKKARVEMLEMGYAEDAFQVQNLDRLLKFREYYQYHQQKKKEETEKMVKNALSKTQIITPKK